jgi:hypothetical protein
MATTHTHSNHPGVVYSILVAVVAAVAVGLSLALYPARPAVSETGAPWVETNGDDGDELGFEGFAGRSAESRRPSLTAYFEDESYRPGDTAHLVLTGTTPAVAITIHRAGTEQRATAANDVMLGSPVGHTIAVRPVRGRCRVSIAVGDWPSGVYFARLTGGRRVGYAPFVLAPRRLGEHRQAVVLPTQTWQAYNYRDDNRDGVPDTWYADARRKQALLVRPFLNRGVPPHWKYYDAPFLRWLVASGKQVDYLSDAELRSVRDGRALAAAYSLVVFSGHHEYVTEHEYDVVSRYRDLGGNLAFLSANNFYWKITLDGGVMTRVAKWRDLGRPEAALVGVQYIANDEGEHRGSWVVRNTAAAPWLFAGTDLARGDRFNSGGIEIDKLAPASPAGVKVLAEIPDLFGPGYTGQMTYYETRAGARVFAAGAFSLACSSWTKPAPTLLENLWTRLAD